MTARERCGSHEDGRHRYRFAVSRMAGTPHYGCGPSCPVVLPAGDGIADDAAYLAPDVLVVSCAACDVEVEVGTSGVITDDGTGLCRRCDADPATPVTLVERYGDPGPHRCRHGVCLDECCTDEPDPCGFCLDEAGEVART